MANAAVIQYKKQLALQCVYNRSIACQTGENNNEYIYYLTDKKTLKLYYSQVYKENVLSFNLSSSKSFIMNHKIWEQFKKLIPIIEQFFGIISVQTSI